MTSLKKRVWIRSGTVEDLDLKQQRLLDLVLGKIQHYYRDLYRTGWRYRYPLSLARLMKLCKRNSYAVMGAVRILANSVPVGSDELPPIYYDRVSAERNASHRPYRIFLRTRQA